MADPFEANLTRGYTCVKDCSNVSCKREVQGDTDTSLCRSGHNKYSAKDILSNLEDVFELLLKDCKEQVLNWIKKVQIICQNSF